MLRIFFSFLFLLGSFEIAHAAESDLPVGVWYHRMHGDLDKKKFLCEGFAQINETKNADGANCITWSIIKRVCKGDEDVDWLHAEGKSGEVCEKGEDWLLTRKLPGAGICEPHVLRGDGGKATSLSLYCSWKCADGEPACSGNAFYKFSAP